MAAYDAMLILPYYMYLRSKWENLFLPRLQGK